MCGLERHGVDRLAVRRRQPVLHEGVGIFIRGPGNGRGCLRDARSADVRDDGRGSIERREDGVTGAIGVSGSVHGADTVVVRRIVIKASERNGMGKLERSRGCHQTVRIVYAVLHEGVGELVRLPRDRRSSIRNARRINIHNDRRCGIERREGEVRRTRLVVREVRGADTIVVRRIVIEIGKAHAMIRHERGGIDRTSVRVVQAVLDDGIRLFVRDPDDRGTAGSDTYRHHGGNGRSGRVRCREGGIDRARLIRRRISRADLIVVRGVVIEAGEADGMARDERSGWYDRVIRRRQAVLHEGVGELVRGPCDGRGRCGDDRHIDIRDDRRRDVERREGEVARTGLVR